jgi:hypothetical protein
MKNTNKFIGVDINIEISLFEYNIICKPYKKDGRTDEYFCIYNQNGLFGTGYITEEFLDNLINCKEWMNEEDTEQFLNFVGVEKLEWLSFEFITKLYGLISYYGTENIFGTDYYPLSEKELRKLYKF